MVKNDRTLKEIIERVERGYAISTELIAEHGFSIAFAMVGKASRKLMEEADNEMVLSIPDFTSQMLRLGVSHLMVAWMLIDEYELEREDE